MTRYYVGLMSGTSMDGIDATLVRFLTAGVEIGATFSLRYPPELQEKLLHAAGLPLDEAPDADGELHRAVGECFLEAALGVIRKSGVPRQEIAAIGSHGQTLRHRPDAPEPFSLQVGDADIIASGSGLPTVANFRQADLDAGGQGAPLVPPFHQWLFSSGDKDRVVVNIGGIANITHLPCGEDPVIGFDTGPGNGLMDRWIRSVQKQPFDNDGRWAAAGHVVPELLDDFLSDPYFAEAPPKSTGFEYFNTAWIERFDTERFDAADVQATLSELTARTIAIAINTYCPGVAEVFVCGGGAHNSNLLSRLRQNLPQVSIASTAKAGLDPDWVEAVAFAWLARRRLRGETGNLPSVTGASHKVLLGDIHSA